jgi:hypothetical protein
MLGSPEDADFMLFGNNGFDGLPEIIIEEQMFVRANTDKPTQSLTFKDHELKVSQLEAEKQFHRTLMESADR